MACVPIISNGTVETQDCQSCGGYGWHVVPICCMRPGHSCCGEPVQGQEECQECGGSGQISLGYHHYSEERNG